MWEFLVLLLLYLLLEYLQKKAVQKIAEHGHGIHPNKFEEPENVIKEEKNANLTIQHAEEMSAKVTVERTKVEDKEKQSVNVTKERGNLPVLEYYILRQNRVEMVNKLVPEKLIPYLIENKVIDQDDVEKIQKKCKDLRRKGAETMLDIVYNSGKWAFEKLIEVLQQTGYQELTQKLTVDLQKKRTGPSSINPRKQRGRLSGIEFEVLKDNHVRLVNELDSSILKNHLFQNDLIDEDDLERITKKDEELRKEGAEEMINIIYNSGQNVFPKLLKSLGDAGYRELSSKLDSDLKEKVEQRTAEHGQEIHLNTFETENVLKGGKKQIITNQHAKNMSAKVIVERTKAQQIEKQSLKVTKERGKVPVLEYYILRQNRVEMVNELVPEKLIPFLKKNNFIDRYDVRKIEKKCKVLKRKGVETVLNIVNKSGSWAFEKLIEVLQQTGYQKLAQKLTVDLEKKRTDPSSTNTKRHRGRLSGIEIKVLKINHERLVDELDSGVLKNYLFQNDLIDKDDLEKITKKEEELRRKGAEELFTIIHNSVAGVFHGLVTSLREAGYKQLSSELSNAFQRAHLSNIPRHHLFQFNTT